MAKNWTFENATFAQDILQFEVELQAAITEAERSLAPAITETLYEHIQSDVYARYEPKRYVRRSDQPYSYGGASIDDLGSNTKAKYAPLSVEIDYNPDGESDQWEHPAYGDDLIRRIEQGGKWEWNVSMPKRPFFRNTVSELIEGGRIASTYSEAINAENPNLDFKLDGNDVWRDYDDWVF